MPAPHEAPVARSSGNVLLAGFLPSERRTVRAAYLLALIAAVAVQIRGFIFFLHSGNADQQPFLSDLAVYRHAGEFLRDGLPLYSGTAFVHTSSGHLPWTYPPFGALVMVPLTWLPPLAMNLLWLAVTAVALVALARVVFAPLLARVARPRLALAGLTVAALLVTPVSDGVGLGQIGILLTLLCLLDAVVLAGRRSRWTGTLVGVAIAIKLTPAVFLPYWLLTRQYRAAATALLSWAACWGLAAVVAWQDSVDYLTNRRFLTVSTTIGDWTETRFNQSWRGLTYRLFDGSTAVWVALVAATVLLGYAGARWCHQRGDLLSAATLVGFVGVLCSPVAWHHHGVWAVPALAVLLGSDGARTWVLGTLPLWLLGCYPPRAFQLPNSSEYWTALYVLLAALVVLRVERRTPSTRVTAPAA